MGLLAGLVGDWFWIVRWVIKCVVGWTGGWSIECWVIGFVFLGEWLVMWLVG